MVLTKIWDALGKAIEAKENNEKNENVVFDKWLNVSYISAHWSEVIGNVLDKNTSWESPEEWYVMIKSINNGNVFAVKEETLRQNKTLKIFTSDVEKWLEDKSRIPKRWKDYSKQDILRVLNENNQWEWTVEAIYDDGIDFKTLSNREFFVGKDSIQKVDISSLKKWESVAFELPWKDLNFIEKNKLNIKKMNKLSLKDGIYEWVISRYEQKNNKYMQYKWYYVMIGNVDWEQEEIFLDIKDMKTAGHAVIWNIISLDVKETDTGFDVKEVYLKEWSKFLLKPENYRSIISWEEKGWLRVKVWHYNGVLHKDMIPQWFKNGDSVNLVVSGLRFAERKVYKDVNRNFIWFKNPGKESLVKAKVEMKIHKWETKSRTLNIPKGDEKKNKKDNDGFQEAVA